MLSFSKLLLGGTVYTGQFPNAANDVLLVTGITCSNTATTLSECTFSHFTKTYSCDAKRIAAIKCHSKFSLSVMSTAMLCIYYIFYIDCTDRDIQIIPYNSYNKQMGRIEACVNGTWGTVCSDFFDDNDAKVACRQLGYSHLGMLKVIHY